MMELRARHQLKGTITANEVGAVMADVSVDIGNDQTLASAITKNSVERLGLKVGDEVVVIIKATEVMLGKPAS
jgi:molybdopterin-binding protein